MSRGEPAKASGKEANRNEAKIACYRLVIGALAALRMAAMDGSDRARESAATGACRRRWANGLLAALISLFNHSAGFAVFSQYIACR
jgi:hypothetical protein